MAAEQKRSYYLPKKLIDVFDKECHQKGFVRQKAAAAAMWKFLKSSPEQRHAMFENLAKFLGKDG